jgi:hypothetical protein
MATPLSYPNKPWEDKQVHELIPGIKFYYHAGFQRWIPISVKGIIDDPLDDGVHYAPTTDELQRQIEQLEAHHLSDGKLWKLDHIPPNHSDNDIWYNIKNGFLYSYHKSADTWVQII